MVTSLEAGFDSGGGYRLGGYCELSARRQSTPGITIQQLIRGTHRVLGASAQYLKHQCLSAGICEHEFRACPRQVRAAITMVALQGEHRQHAAVRRGAACSRQYTRDIIRAPSRRLGVRGNAHAIGLSWLIISCSSLRHCTAAASTPPTPSG